MDSEILDQLTDLGRDVDSEFPKPKEKNTQRSKLIRWTVTMPIHF